MSSLGNGNTDCNTVILLISNYTVVSRKVIEFHDDNDNDDHCINQ